MKLTKYITTACIAALFTGCDYLDFDETTGMTKEEMYSYFGNVTSLSTFVYSQLPQDFGAIGDALRDAATDNAVYTWNQSSVYNVYNGTWSPLKTVDDVWSNYYTAIREANSFLENYSLEVLERFKWNVDYEIDVEKAKMRVHEVRALRAFFYLELAKRYGDIPLLTRTYQIDEINSVEKTPFDKVIDFIVDECDKAAPELQVRFEHAKKLLARMRGMSTYDEGYRELLEKLVPGIPETSIICPPFHCDHGDGIKLGEHVFVNANCTFLDGGYITIGAHTLVGPCVQIYTPHHPMDYQER